MSSAFETIDTSSDAGVLTITLNRPDALNAFNEQMSIELGAALRTANREDSIRCIVLTGAGRAFCSGQDLAEIKSHYAAGAAPLDFGRHLQQRFNPIAQRLRTMEKPVVAAINGVAAGAGASFALACDLKIASDKASLLMAFVHVGLIPDSAGAQVLLQHVGYARAAELCFLGEKLPADEALRHGLVNRVVPGDQLLDETMQVARKLASLPTRAIGLTKRALNRAWTATVSEQLDFEAFVQQTAGQTADHAEGVRAFLEKRRPSFQGR